MVKVPVFVTLKNATDHFMFVDFEPRSDGGINKEELDKIVMENLPVTVPRNSVVKITCFCPRCQEELAIQLNVVIGMIEKIIVDRFPVQTIAKVIPLIHEELDSTLADGWSFFQHLIAAIVAMQPHIYKAIEKAEEFQAQHQNEDGQA